MEGLKRGSRRRCLDYEKGYIGINNAQGGGIKVLVRKIGGIKEDQAYGINGNS